MTCQKGFVSVVKLLVVGLLVIGALFIPIPRYQNGGCLEIAIDPPMCYPAGWKLGPSLWWQIFEGQKTVSHPLQLTPTSNSTTNDAEQDSQKPSSPLTLDINFADVPRRGQTARLIVNVQTVIMAPNTSIKVSLPDGVELVEGNLTWDGDLTVNATHQLQITVRFNRDGNFVISAEAISKSSGGARFGQKRSLYVKIEGSNSTVTNYTPIPTLDPNRPQVKRTNSTQQPSDNYNPLGKKGLEKK